MKKEIPEEIIESIKHFNKRAESSLEVKEFLEEIGKLDKIKFNDIKNIEKHARVYIKTADAQYRAGHISEQEHIFHRYYATVNLVHDTRWLNGNYSEELDPISKKMKDIESAYGLKEDEYWTKGDAPEEYQALDIEYEKVLESKLQEEFIEFGVEDIAELHKNDKAKLKALVEMGRQSVFIKDDLTRLDELAKIYENESNTCGHAGAYFAAGVMLAAAIEARLIIHCLKHREIVRKTLLKMGLSNKKLNSKNPLDWKLNTLIEVCGNAGWLPNFETKCFVFNTKNIAHTLRNTRNLVHPGRHAKLKASLTLGKEQFNDIKKAHKLLSSSLEWATLNT